MAKKRPTGEALTRKRRVDLERRAKRRELVNLFKCVPCADCQQRLHHTAMDFDHLPEFEKEADISRLFGNNRPFIDLCVEIAKCEVVCANCHRVRSWQRQLDAR